jgi:hypothetical protein
MPADKKNRDEMAPSPRPDPLSGALLKPVEEG